MVLAGDGMGWGFFSQWRRRRRPSRENRASADWLFEIS